MNNFYNRQIKKYNSQNYKSDNILVVGDVHGDFLQTFIPLKASGLITGVEFKNDNIEVVFNNNIENCPTVVFLGDYFHKSLFNKSFLIVHALLKIKSVVKNKLILLLGNHDVAQYVYVKGILKRQHIPMYDNFVNVCNNELENSPPAFVLEFIEAIENNIIDLAYVDNKGNLYSHTVINSKFLEISGSISSGVGFYKSDSLISEFEFSKDKTDPFIYNTFLMNTMRKNFNECIKKDYRILLNYINYLQDRPLTKNFDKEKCFKIDINYLQDRPLTKNFKTDIAHSSRIHFIGHTTGFKRYPKDNSKIIEILSELVKLLSSPNSENFRRNIKEICSKLHVMNTFFTTRYGNLMCCDSQALFTYSDICLICHIENEFIKYIPTIKKYITRFYEQSIYYVITDSKPIMRFGEIIELIW